MKFDFRLMMKGAVGPAGVGAGDLSRFERWAAAAHEDLARRRARGELPHLDFPHRRPDAALRKGRDLRRGCRDYVLAGYGGAGLSGRTWIQSLRPDLAGILTGSPKHPRFHFVNDVDPDATADLLKGVDWRRAVVHLISKGGDSPEILSHFYIARDRLRRGSRPADWARRLLVTTGPGKGALRRLAREGGHPISTFPDSLSGRFALFSDVGLLPAAVAGIDVRALLRGAAWMDRRCESPSLSVNPALLGAALHFLAARRGLRTSVIMPYHRDLKPAAEYFRFVWAGSLGKRVDLKGREVFAGLTPLTAVGMEDQHSQVQLFAEGPFDKTLTFLTLDLVSSDVRIPAGKESILRGRTLSQVNRIWAESTARGLAAQGRPSGAISLPRLDAFWAGALLYYFQRLTLYLAALFEVNPYNQPGVAPAKKIAAARLGRSAEAGPPAGQDALFLDFSEDAADGRRSRSNPGRGRRGRT